MNVIIIVGSILNPLGKKISVGTRKKRKHVKTVTPRDCRPNFHMRQCDWLKGSHMTKGSLAPEKKQSIHIVILWRQILANVI